MSNLTKMVETMQAIGVDHLRTLDILFAMASNIEFTNNCIEDLRKEIEASRKEIEKLKVKTDPTL